MRANELYLLSRDGKRSQQQPSDSGPSLSRFTFGELDEILFQKYQWDSRQEAIASGSIDLDDLPSLSDVDDDDASQVLHRQEMDYMVELEPVSQEILDYLELCPRSEWDQYYEYADDQELLARARTDPDTFMEYCFRDKDKSPWKQQDFHREWQGLIPTIDEAKQLSRGETILAYTSTGLPILDTDGNHLKKSQTTLVVAPREHAKSTQLGVGRTIWELGNNPDLRVSVCTASPKLAKDLLFDIAQNIERNPRVRKVFPNLRPDYEAGWNKTTLFVTGLDGNPRSTDAGKDPSVSASSVLSTGAGSRADILLGDDVIDFRNAIANPSMRPMVKRAFGEVWMSLMPPDGRCIYTATPWHEDDATHQYKKESSWTVWWKPAIWEYTDSDGIVKKRVLWPGKWSLTALNIRKNQIGEREFARQFLLKTLSNDEATFPENVIDRCLDLTRSEFGENVPDDWPRVGGLDLAASLRKKGAYTVLFTFAIEPITNRLVPMHMVRHKIDFTSMVELIIELAPLLRWDLLVVENNGYQQAMVSTLEQRHLHGLINVKGHTTTTNKHSMEIGLPAMSAVFGAGGFSIPCGGDKHPLECLCNLCAWVGELRGHPTAQFSDTVMATWFAQRAAVLLGINFVNDYVVVTEPSGTTQVKALVASDLDYLEISNLPRLNSNHESPAARQVAIEAMMFSKASVRRYDDEFAD